jgi:YD repeat-containing protein
MGRIVTGEGVFKRRVAVSARGALPGDAAARHDQSTRRSIFRLLTTALALTAAAAPFGAARAENIESRKVSDLIRGANSIDENGVDLVSGSFVLQVPLYRAPQGRLSASLDLSFPNGSPIMPGGLIYDALNLFARVQFNSGNVVTLPDRRVSNPTGAPSKGNSIIQTPGMDSSHITFIGADGARADFTIKGVVAYADRIVFPDGEKWTYVYDNITWNGYPYTYSPVPRIKYIRTNRGEGVQFSYASNLQNNASSFKVVKLTFFDESQHVCSWVGPADCSALANLPGKIQFSTDGQTITDATGRQTVLTYGGPDFTKVDLVAIQYPGSPERNVQITYAHDTHEDWGDVTFVSAVQRGGRTWSYNFSPAQIYYNPQMGWCTPSYTASAVTVTLPGGATRSYTGDVCLSHLKTVTDELGRTTTYDYDILMDTVLDNRRPILTQFPEGNRVTATWGPRGNATSVTRHPKPGSGISASTVTWSYPQICTNPVTCNQPEYTVDAQGGRTDFTYDPVHGGITSVLGPAVNGIRQQKRYVYEQRTAYVKNGAGTLVPAETPIWVLASTAECRTQGTCAGTSDEVVTANEYGAPGTAQTLLVRGVAVQSSDGTLRTCYRYDPQGNRIAETAPRAAATTCQ